MNLSIKSIDRIARSRFVRFLDPARFGASLAPRHRHLVFMSIWAVVFVGMSVAQGVGDDHPGQWIPFWRQACLDARPYACPYLADLQITYCRRGSGWACNAAGLSHVALSQSGEDLRRLDLSGAAEPFQRGCEKGFITACRNLKTLTTGIGEFSGAPPSIEDLPIILRGSKGEIKEREPATLYALACRQGWPNMCELTDTTGN